MPLRSDKYDINRFDCLNPDLSGVRAMLTVQDAERQITDKRSQIQALKGRAPSGESLMSEIELAIKGYLIPIHTQAERIAMLREATGVVQTAIKRQLDGIPESELLPATGAILGLYTQFDVQQFRSDFKSAFGTVPDSDPAAEIEALNDQIVELQEQIGETWPDDANRISGFFRGCRIPQIWYSFRVSPRFTEIDVARVIIEAFIREWRQRAPLFGPPVTITGTDIRTLPESIGRNWRELYGFMGLADLQKAPFLTQHRIADKVALDMQAAVDEAPPDLPEIFQKRGRGRPKKKSPKPVLVEQPVSAAPVASPESADPQADVVQDLV